MKKLTVFLTALMIGVLVLGGLLGCGRSAQMYSKGFFACDTLMNISWYGDEKVYAGCLELVKDLEREISVTDSSSAIYKLNHGEEVALSDNAAFLVKESLDRCALLDGYLDISIQPVVELWGFGTDAAAVPDDADLAAAMRRVGCENVSVDQSGHAVILGGSGITLGATAKGYIGDLLRDYLKDNGVSNALLNLGGNVVALGTKADGALWRIAIADPDNSQSPAAGISISDKCVVTSGAYERNFVQDGKVYHHILDPATGYPAESDLLSVSIIGASGLDCDALSTGLFVMGKDGAVDFYKTHKDMNFDMILITADKEFVVTGGIKDSFAPDGKYAGAKVVMVE